MASSVAWSQVASSDVGVVKRATTTPVFGAPVPTAAVSRCRPLPLAILGRPRQAAGESRVPVVALALSTSATVVVVVATAAVDVSWRRVVPVARYPFSVDDPVVPRVNAGSGSPPISGRWVIHQIKVHQHPEGEPPAATCGLRGVELCLPIG